MKLWDIIWFNKGRGHSEGNNYYKSLLWPRRIYFSLMLTLMGVGIGLVSLFTCSVFMDRLGTEMFISYFSEPLILTLNLLPPVLLIWFFYFVTGRAWSAFLITGGSLLLLSVVGYYKIRIRTEPFVALDLTLIGEAAGVLSGYELEFSGRVMLCILAFIVGLLFAIFFMREKNLKIFSKTLLILGASFVLIVMAGLYTHVYTDDAVYKKATNRTGEYDPWTELQVYVSKGFLYPFINSIPDALPSTPEGYSKETAQNILAAYESEAIPESKKVNVISIMLESYTDLSAFPDTGIEDFVYAPLHRLQEESYTGTIVANTFGGGTIDSERAYLTGCPNKEDYRSNTNSYVRWLTDNGYTVQGLHTGNNWFYNRQNVMSYIGFDDYRFLEDYQYANRTDEFFFKALTEMWEARDKTRPYFNYSLTYQNHGAYDKTQTVPESYINRGDLTEEAYNILNNYLSGIADTSRRLEELADYFRDAEEPVVLVLYGDHMPWLGDGSFVYHELGIPISAGEEGGFYNYYSTPYLIWANDAAKKAVGSDIEGQGGRISPCYLMTVLSDLLGWPGDSYLKLTREVMAAVPVISTTTGKYEAEGILTEDLTGTPKELVQKLEIAEYYRKHSFRK